MMKLTMKKTLVAAAIAAMAMSGAANAASTGAAATGSSLIFSAWDAAGSYSLDLGSFLNDFIGADVTTSSPSGSSFAGAVASNGTVANYALTGFNLTSGSWNLAASDSSGRKRVLISETTPFAGTNAQVQTAANAVGGYIGLGAAAGTATGTLATSTDAWYANSSSWGDNFGGSGITGTANLLTGVSNLVVAWQTSQSASLAQNAAGFANLTAGGQNVTAQILGSGSNAYLHLAVAAVPEADTYAMFLAGLGLMGFIARRRMQA